jgi:hypothetical protein
MNSILQCLNQIDWLTEFVLSGNYKKDINKENVLGTGGRLADEYATFLRAMMWSNVNSIVDTSALKVCCILKQIFEKLTAVRIFKLIIMYPHPILCLFDFRNSWVRFTQRLLDTHSKTARSS